MAARVPQRSGLSLALILNFVVALPREASPQEQPPVLFPMTLGSRVRVEAPTVVSGRITGVIIEMDEKSLAILSGDRRLNVPRQAITRVEVNIGTRRKPLKGMIIGAGIGAVVFPPYFYGNCLSDCGRQWDPGNIAAGAGLGALCGAGIGALVKRDRWRLVPTEQVQLSLHPIRGNGFRASLSVAF